MEYCEAVSTPWLRKGAKTLSLYFISQYNLCNDAIKWTRIVQVQEAENNKIIKKRKYHLSVLAITV